MKTTMQKRQLVASVQKTATMFTGLLPIIFGVILLSALVLELLPTDAIKELFGAGDVIDALLGALIGGVLAGHPVTSYVLGGELLHNGVSLVAVTAFLISWVTVGSIQLPAEAMVLGWRFALYRNLLCFASSIAIAVVVMATMQLFG